MSNETVNNERANVRSAFHLVQQEVYSLLDSVALVEEMVAHPKEGDGVELVVQTKGLHETVEGVLAQLDKLRRAQFSYDDEVSKQLG